MRIQGNQYQETRSQGNIHLEARVQGNQHLDIQRPDGELKNSVPQKRDAEPTHSIDDDAREAYILDKLRRDVTPPSRPDAGNTDWLSVEQQEMVHHKAGLTSNTNAVVNHVHSYNYSPAKSHVSSNHAVDSPRSGSSSRRGTHDSPARVVFAETKACMANARENIREFLDNERVSRSVVRRELGLHFLSDKNVAADAEMLRELTEDGVVPLDDDSFGTTDERGRGVTDSPMKFRKNRDNEQGVRSGSTSKQTAGDARRSVSPNHSSDSSAWSNASWQDLHRAAHSVEKDTRSWAEILEHSNDAPPGGAGLNQFNDAKKIQRRLSSFSEVTRSAPDCVTSDSGISTQVGGASNVSIAQQGGASKSENGIMTNRERVGTLIAQQGGASRSENGIITKRERVGGTLPSDGGIQRTGDKLRVEDVSLSQRGVISSDNGVRVVHDYPRTDDNVSASAMSNELTTLQMKIQELKRRQEQLEWDQRVYAQRQSVGEHSSKATYRQHELRIEGLDPNQCGDDVLWVDAENAGKSVPFERGHPRHDVLSGDYVHEGGKLAVGGYFRQNGVNLQNENSKELQNGVLREHESYRPVPSEAVYLRSNVLLNQVNPAAQAPCTASILTENATLSLSAEFKVHKGQRELLLTLPLHEDSAFTRVTIQNGRYGVENRRLSSGSESYVGHLDDGLTGDDLTCGRSIVEIVASGKQSQTSPPVIRTTFVGFEPIRAFPVTVTSVGGSSGMATRFTELVGTGKLTGNASSVVRGSVGHDERERDGSTPVGMVPGITGSRDGINGGIGEANRVDELPVLEGKESGTTICTFVECTSDALSVGASECPSEGCVGEAECLSEGCVGESECPSEGCVGESENGSDKERRKEGGGEVEETTPSISGSTSSRSQPSYDQRSQ